MRPLRSPNRSRHEQVSELRRKPIQAFARGNFLKRNPGRMENDFRKQPQTQGGLTAKYSKPCLKQGFFYWLAPAFNLLTNQQPSFFHPKEFFYCFQRTLKFLPLCRTKQQHPLFSPKKSLF